MNRKPAPNTVRQLLRKACRARGLNEDGARLLRLGSNTVYRLKAPIVVRIGRPDADHAVAHRAIAVARWLESVGYPAVRALDVDQPLIVSGHAVTFWETLSDEYATIEELADVLARLHRLSAPASLNLPELRPFANADSWIAESRFLSSGDREYLADELAHLHDEYARLEFVLPQGIIHGDANIGNVLHGFDGKPVIIDLDDFCVGPREWDLIQTAVYADRFGWHSRDEYAAFAHVYGFNLTRWPGYPVLANVREFILVTWMIRKAGESKQKATEARKRLDALRTGASRTDWRPF